MHSDNAHLLSCAVQGQIHISVLFKPVSQDPSWGAGVLGGSKGMEAKVQDGEVPHSYFPMRSGCRVTMYNDAHQVRCAL